MSVQYGGAPVVIGGMVLDVQVRQVPRTSQQAPYVYTHFETCAMHQNKESMLHCFIVAVKQEL